MATIKGVWVFNESLSTFHDYTFAIGDMGQVNFVSNGESFIRFSYYEYYGDDGTIVNMRYVRSDNTGREPFSFATDYWMREEYKMVDFGTTEQTVPDAFKTWMETNATQRNPTLTYDLTQLNLSAGTHTISVIAKADGYNASAASTGAAFVVEASTVTLEAGTYTAKTGFALTLNDTRYDISFSSYNTNFSSIRFGFGTMMYNSTLVAEDAGSGVVWENTNYKTVKLETPQEVDETFGTWFNANFEKQPDTVTIEAGTYVANKNYSTLTFAQFNQDIAFTSNNTSYSKMKLDGHEFEEWYFRYDTTTVYQYLAYEEGHEWINTAYKTITISTPQSVSPEFGEWFNSNFTKQLPTPRIDLSGSYSGYIDISYANGYIWGDLIDGTIGNGTFTTSEGKTLNMYKYTDNKIMYLSDGDARANIKNGSSDVTQTQTISNQVYTCSLTHSGGD